jgi:hypothetical protein
MAKQMSKKLADDICREVETVCGIAQQLEALARVLTRVETNDNAQEPIHPTDFVCIMQVFQEKIATLEDLAGGIAGYVEHHQGTPGPMMAV